MLALASRGWHLPVTPPDTAQVTNENLLAPLSIQDCCLNPASEKWQTLQSDPQTWHRVWLPRGLGTHTTGTIQWAPRNLALISPKAPRNSAPISPKHTLHMEQGSQAGCSGGRQVLNGKHTPECFAGTGLQLTRGLFSQLLYMTFYHTWAICLEQSQFTLSTGVLYFNKWIFINCTSLRTVSVLLTMNGHINLPKQSSQPNPAKVTTVLSMSFGCVRKAGIRPRNRVLCACCLSPSLVEYSWSSASDLNGSWTNSLMFKISSSPTGLATNGT